MPSDKPEIKATLAVLLSELAETLSRLDGGLMDAATLRGVEDDVRRLVAALQAVRQDQPIDPGQLEGLKNLIARHEAIKHDLGQRLATMADFGTYLNKSLNS